MSISCRHHTSIHVNHNAQTKCKASEEEPCEHHSSPTSPPEDVGHVCVRNLMCGTLGGGASLDTKDLM